MIPIRDRIYRKMNVVDAISPLQVIKKLERVSDTDVQLESDGSRISRLISQNDAETVDCAVVKRDAACFWSTTS